jgi:hypothetical protein
VGLLGDSTPIGEGFSPRKILSPNLVTGMAFSLVQNLMPISGTKTIGISRRCRLSYTILPLLMPHVVNLKLQVLHSGIRSVSVQTTNPKMRPRCSGLQSRGQTEIDNGTPGSTSVAPTKNEGRRAKFSAHSNINIAQLSSDKKAPVVPRWHARAVCVTSRGISLAASRQGPRRHVVKC